MTAPSGSLDTFDPPAVKNVPIEKLDDMASAIEPNNLIAINSLKAYRALRYGRHLDLILTDQHSYRGPDATDVGGRGEDDDPAFTGMFPEPAMILDGGRAFDGGNPPAELSFGEARVPNPRKDAPPRTILGAEQKAWFKDQLRRSSATWKIWGNSLGALDERADPQNLPDGLTKQPWPADTYAQIGGGDYGTAYVERGEIYDLVRDAKITGFAIVSGDRHSFWAGYAAPLLPPAKFEPVGLSFVGASLSAPARWRPTSTAFPRTIRCVRCSWSTGRREARMDVQHAPEARRPLVPRIREELRPEARSRALESEPRPAPRIRRPGRSRLREGAAHRR